MIDLSEIITRLSNQVTVSGTWRLELSELESLTRDPVGLYRAVYESRLIGRDVYDPASAGELVTLLEAAGLANAEAGLRDAGLFLPHDDRVELTGRFVRHLRRALVAHVPEAETFRAMITHLRRYDIALATYCDTFLAVEPVVHACSAEFTEDRRGSEVLLRTSNRYLESLLSRHIVRLEDIAPSLFELLRTIAREEGALPRIEDDGAASAGPRSRGAGPSGGVRADGRAAALRLFAISTPRPSRSTIQSAYRRLMRTYHPDINPDGLEMAKRVNAAYVTLLTSEDLF